MTDFLGKELQIGDEVVFMQLKYRNLLRGKIIAMSKIKIQIKHAPDNWGKTETRQDGAQTVKIL
jgi:hypothetical protein